MSKRVVSQSPIPYEAVMIFWRMVTQIFFREIRPRGAFNIPRSGPVIFVGAPHNNQVRQSAFTGVNHLIPLVSGPSPPQLRSMA